MIYKFIDVNGSEITVNSISSLQALLDGETIKENTKVKAGLRGKWTTAKNIDELVFTKEIEKEVEQENAAEPIEATVVPTLDSVQFSSDNPMADVQQR